MTDHNSERVSGGAGTEPGDEDTGQVPVPDTERVADTRPRAVVAGMDRVPGGMDGGTDTVDRMEMEADQTQVNLHTTVGASLHYVDILLGEVGEILVFIAHWGHVNQFVTRKSNGTHNVEHGRDCWHV